MGEVADRHRNPGPDGGTEALEETDVTVEVFVRSLAAPAGVHDEQIAVLERLKGLEDRGRLAGWNVTIWGERLCECEICEATAAGRTIRDRMREFRDWTERAGGEVSLPFERREIESEFAGTVVEGIVPPRVTLALYAEDRLLRVYPYTEDGTTHNVSDALDRLDVAGQQVQSPPSA